MVCSSKDQFQKGSQVYFCYGRLPNRLLLSRYGISLEHNKYNHLFIRIDISDFVLKNKPLHEYVSANIKLNRYRRFKVKRITFCSQILAFHRSLLWVYTDSPEGIFCVTEIDSERKILSKVKTLFEMKLNSYKHTL